MFNKLQRIIIFSLLGALAFGSGGAILGYIQTIENSWIWLLGLAGIGLIAGATLGFLSGGRKNISSLGILGVVAGLIVGYFTYNPSYETWLKLAIIGLVLGIIIGISFVSSGTGERSYNNRNLRCSECKGKASKNDKYCPNCGAEFDK
jgi:hypothetical protein